tara:strand:+ start:403 stop:897 length:495 start_codon:yes stop_codon:yes gene_type:complete
MNIGINMKKVKVSFDTWIQLLGMVGVLGGLVFVGLEMQQSQKIALAGQQANRVQLFSSMMDANNEQGIDQQKLQMILSGQIPMTKDYEWVVMNGLHRMWWIYENDFLQNELGLMDENIWQAKRNAMEANYNFCEGRPVFDIRKNTLDSRLVELVESFPDECADQ